MPSTNTVNPQLRLRVFAGPNGSGKSTIVKEVAGTVVNDRPIDLGDYINADDITQALRTGKYSFNKFRLKINLTRLLDFAEGSGLLDKNFPFEWLRNSLVIKGNSIHLTNLDAADKVGQVIARFLREEMLRLKRRFSFETVFSHDSNLDIMRRAKDAGYKVYLYFVSTESPEINKYRVQLRKRQGGHDVPANKIESRYIRSLELLYDAAQIAYQAFFFDNSKEDAPFELVAHFKKKAIRKVWDKDTKNKASNWFKRYYSAKVTSRKKKNTVQ